MRMRKSVMITKSAGDKGSPCLTAYGDSVRHIAIYSHSRTRILHEDSKPSEHTGAWSDWAVPVIIPKLSTLSCHLEGLVLHGSTIWRLVSLNVCHPIETCDCSGEIPPSLSKLLSTKLKSPPSIHSLSAARSGPNLLQVCLLAVATHGAYSLCSWIMRISHPVCTSMKLLICRTLLLAVRVRSRFALHYGRRRAICPLLLQRGDGIFPFLTISDSTPCSNFLQGGSCPPNLFQISLLQHSCCFLWARGSHLPRSFGDAFISGPVHLVRLQGSYQIQRQR